MKTIKAIKTLIVSIILQILLFPLTIAIKAIEYTCTTLNVVRRTIQYLIIEIKKEVLE